MYIYTVKYSRNMSNTREPGDKGERSIGVKVNRTQIYTATIHYITTQYATGATAQYSHMLSPPDNLGVSTLDVLTWQPPGCRLPPHGWQTLI